MANERAKNVSSRGHRLLQKAGQMSNPAPMNDDASKQTILHLSLLSWKAGDISMIELKKVIQAIIDKAVVEARDDAIWNIMSPETEGLFDSGELFIKRKPIEDAIISMVGYEKYKALQEAVDAQLQAHKPEA